MQRHLQEYFQLPGHTGFSQDTYVTLTDKTDPRAPTKREHYWILTLKTKAPMGLMLKVLTELPSYIFILQIFIFVDLDGLLQDYSRFIWIVTFVLFYHLRQYLYLSGS